MPVVRVVDPGSPTVTPSVRAWELRDGRYAEADSATGDTPLDLAAPYPVRVSRPTWSPEAELPAGDRDEFDRVAELIVHVLQRTAPGTG